MLNGRNDRKRNVGAVLARFVFTINRQYTNRMPDREKVKETVRQARSVLSSDTQVWQNTTELVKVGANAHLA